jgi:hypothetical protein
VSGAAEPSALEDDGGIDALAARLRDLALVELDALLAGAGDRREVLLETYADDLADGLRAARACAAALAKSALGGPDPLALLDVAPSVRARGGGREVGRRVTDRLAARARAARQLALLDDLCADLVPRLLETDRRRGDG